MSVCGCATLHLASEYFLNLIFPPDALLSVYPESELSQGMCKAPHKPDLHLQDLQHNPHTVATIVLST